MREGGTVTFGGQTHPADGNAAILVAAPERAAELSSQPQIAVRLLGFGQARVPLAWMPEATVPAARRALDRAGLSIGQIDAIKTHNPFAVNDLYFAQETGVDGANDEQLRMLAGVGASAGADGHAIGDRIDRGTGPARRRPRTVRRMRGRRLGDGGRAGGRRQEIAGAPASPPERRNAGIDDASPCGTRRWRRPWICPTGSIGNAAFAPGKVALTCAGRELHATPDLAREIAQTAAALAACGVGRGDRVAYLGYNSAEQLGLLFACARLGALFAPLSWRLAPPEHRAMLADCRPRVLVVADPFVGPTSGIVDAAEAAVRVGIGAARDGWIDYDRFLASRRIAVRRAPARRAMRHRCCFATRRAPPGSRRASC